MTRTKEQLIIDKEKLQSRLSEAKEALAAIRSGEVDAIIVPGSKGQQIYTISSADTPYRAFIEEMDEGAVTLSKEGMVIYCNRRFAELVNEPIERVIGSYFKSFVIPKDISRFEKALNRKEQNNKNAMILSLVNSLYLKLSFHTLPSYLQGNNCVLVATDVTEMKREQEKLIELASLLDQKFEVIKQLRMRLIEKKIDSDVEIKKLKNSNKKLVQKIALHKQVEADLKLKLKQKKKAL